jgi:hypothetical protein
MQYQVNGIHHLLPTPPYPATLINYDDEHSNEAGVHELVYTESLSHEPLTNNTGMHSRPLPWPN